MKTHISKLLAVAVGSVALLAAASPALAGTGSSYAKVASAVQTGGALTIAAELEQAEMLPCPGCLDLVLPLLSDERYEVREVAAWWFGRRAAEKKVLTEQSLATLGSGTAVQVRNAADVLGTFRHPVAVPALAGAYGRGLTPEARVAIVRALGTIGVVDGNPTLTLAMGDADPSVRAEALTAWLAIRRQADAEPAVALVADPDALVRRKAAAVVGALRDSTGRVALETQLLADSDPVVRRNAAWALGRIGDAASRDALTQAENDPSPLVRLTARTARRQLR